MLYKYEMHVHDSLCSRRGHNPVSYTHLTLPTILRV